VDKIIAWIKTHWSLLAIFALGLALLFAIPSGCTANRELGDARRALGSATSRADNLAKRIAGINDTASRGATKLGEIVATAGRATAATDRAIVLFVGIREQVKILESIYNAAQP